MHMNDLQSKLLSLVEGHESPESYQEWWQNNQDMLAQLLSRGEFLKLKPCKHQLRWVPILTSQKAACAILDRLQLSYKRSNYYQEQYLSELDALSLEHKKRQQARRKQFIQDHEDFSLAYPKFAKALACVLDESDTLKIGASEPLIDAAQESIGFVLPSKVRAFFRHATAIRLSSGVSIELDALYKHTFRDEQYCVLGEFFLHADGDLLLLRATEETIYYYAHTNDEVRVLCKDMDELVEKILKKYISNS